MANRRYSSLFGGVKASGAAQSEAMISKQTAPVVARYVSRFGFDSILIIVKCSTALFAAQPSGVNRALAKQFGQSSLEPMKSIGTMNRDWLVAQAFEPAGSGDFRVARFSSTGLESPVNRQAGKPAPHSGSWKAATTFMPCMEIMNLRRVGRCHQQGAADVSSAELLSGFLCRQDAGSTLGFMERNDPFPARRLTGKACPTGLTRLSWQTLTYAQRRSAIRSGHANTGKTNPGRRGRFVLRFSAAVIACSNGLRRCFSCQPSTLNQLLSTPDNSRS